MPACCVLACCVLPNWAWAESPCNGAVLKDLQSVFLRKLAEAGPRESFLKCGTLARNGTGDVPRLSAGPGESHLKNPRGDQLEHSRKS